MSGISRELLVVTLISTLGSAFSLLSGLMPPPWKAAGPVAGEIQLKDAQALNVIWVDARSEADYAAGHAQNAVLLNNSNWETGIPGLMNLWLSDARPVVVYCSSAQCGSSKQIADRLRAELPEMEVYTLKGGWEAWEE